MPMTGNGSKSFSVKPGDYKLLELVGDGASAKVYRAIYLPYNDVVSVKCLDLDRCNSNLDDIRREAQTTSMIDHPNVVKAYCSFAVEHYLWVIMPFMAQGSCMHLMKIAYPDGFEGPAICTILKETLKALEYLHKQGDIHRDVKAGNILLDSNGDIKLGDFGVTTCMFDKGDRQRSRNTFVGTPCWMAPEVLQQENGYDCKADIWSFGITALELAHGHAPFSKYPPMKVLLMTIQNAPPGLDYDRDKKFSKVRIAMVGKYVGLTNSYLSVTKVLTHACVACKLKLSIDWIAASDLGDESAKQSPKAHESAWTTLMDFIQRVRETRVVACDGKQTFPDGGILTIGDSDSGLSSLSLSGGPVGDPDSDDDDEVDQVHEAGNEAGGVAGGEEEEEDDDDEEEEEEEEEDEEEEEEEDHNSDITDDVDANMTLGLLMGPYYTYFVRVPAAGDILETLVAVFNGNDHINEFNVISGYGMLREVYISQDHSVPPLLYTQELGLDMLSLTGYIRRLNRDISVEYMTVGIIHPDGIVTIGAVVSLIARDEVMILISMTSGFPSMELEAPLVELVINY